jgi:cysteine-rich repeat protein
VSIPGSGDAQSVLDRVQDLTGRNSATLNDQDTNGDAIDDNLLALFATLDPQTPGPFEQVRFDCAAGALIRPLDFDCSIAQPTDTNGSCLVPQGCAMLDRDKLDCKVTRITSAGAIPVTTTSTSPPPTVTTTTQSGPTTTTTTNPHTCGNGSIEGPFETCDDGNMADEGTVHTIPPDACPASCRVEPCSSTSGTVSVSVNFSSTSSIAGYTIFVDYPEGKVVIPGSGQPAAGVITNDPTSTATANDLDYGVLVVAGGLNAIPPSRLLKINFTPCSGPAPSASEFRCTVHAASDPGGNDVPMTCSVSIP